MLQPYINLHLITASIGPGSLEPLQLPRLHNHGDDKVEQLFCLFF